MSVSVVIPWDGSHCPHRLKALAYVRDRWAREYPAWPVIIRPYEREPWRKAIAITQAVEAAPPGVVIISDADVWTPGIRQAVDTVRAGIPWTKPHRRFVRLTPASTQHVLSHDLDLEDAAGDSQCWLEPPYTQVPTGGVVVMTRELALDVPADPRFKGWGCEDTAWAYALTTLVAPPVRGGLTAVHLWHPPQKRRSRNLGSFANENLLARYRAALRDPQAMRALVDEGRAFLSSVSVGGA